jgi:hypothetical protein
MTLVDCCCHETSSERCNPFARPYDAPPRGFRLHDHPPFPAPLHSSVTICSHSRRASSTKLSCIQPYRVGAAPLGSFMTPSSSSGVRTLRSPVTSLRIISTNASSFHSSREGSHGPNRESRRRGGAHQRWWRGRIGQKGSRISPGRSVVLQLRPRLSMLPSRSLPNNKAVGEQSKDAGSNG